MIKEYVKSHKKQLFQLLITLLVGVMLSLIFMLVFYLTGVIKFEDGIKINADLFFALRDNFWLYVVFVAVEAVGGALLCMSPFGSGAFIWLGIALFGANWKSFVACSIGCFLSYMLIDAIGRFGGSKIIRKIFGEEEFQKANDLINEKGLIYVPIAYLLPIFPDDFICLCVGSMRMNWFLHMIFAFIGKAVGIATTIFGVTIIPIDLFWPISMDKLYNYFILGACLIVYITTLFKIAHWIDKKLSAFIKKHKKVKKIEEKEIIELDEKDI